MARRLAPPASIGLRTCEISRDPVVLSCRMGLIVAHADAFLYGFGQGRLQRDNCRIRIGIGHRIPPLLTNTMGSGP
jgi:hypothetical protein